MLVALNVDAQRDEDHAVGQVDAVSSVRLAGGQLAAKPVLTRVSRDSWVSTI
jgi:hypothetical protein